MISLKGLSTNNERYKQGPLGRLLWNFDWQVFGCYCSSGRKCQSTTEMRTSKQGLHSTSAQPPESLVLLGDIVNHYPAAQAWEHLSERVRSTVPSVSTSHLLNTSNLTTLEDWLVGHVVHLPERRSTPRPLRQHVKSHLSPELAVPDPPVGLKERVMIRDGFKNISSVK